MKNILTEALVNSATNASFIFSYTNFAKLRVIYNLYNIDFTTVLSDVKSGCIIQNGKIF